MLKQIICTALAAMIVTCTGAQSFGEIHGRIVDEYGKPAPDVIVIVSNGVAQMSTESDEAGKYRLKPLKPGSYKLWTYFFGTVSDTLANLKVNPDKITFAGSTRVLPVAMMKDIEVEFYRVPLITRDGDHIQTVLAEDLLHRPTTHGGNLAKIVTSMSSDLKPAAEGGGISVRGSREGDMLYFVDGMKIRSSDIAIPAGGIGSVSLYSGGIPAKYGDTTGGIVIVETKSYLEEYYKQVNQ